MKKNSLPTVHVNNQTGMIEVDGKVNIVVTSKWYSLKGCDHIIGYSEVLKEQDCCGSFMWETDFYKKSQVGNIVQGEDCELVVFKFCPECGCSLQEERDSSGEKLNLKKDE